MINRHFFRRLLCTQSFHLLAALALLLLCGSSGALHANTYHAETPPDSGLKVTVTRAFESIPLRGYLPLKVSIHNSFNSEQSWELSSAISINGYRINNETETVWQQTLSVPAGQTRSFELLMPLANAETYSGSSGFLKISGPRTSGSIWLYNYSSSYRSPSLDTVFGLASESIRHKYSERIKDYLSNNGSNLDSESVTLYFLPTDWRGYAGVDLLWFQQGDWNKATPEQRRAILQWVAQGGDLRILKDEGTPKTAAVSGIPGAGNGLIPLGAGVVRVYPYMDQDELFAKPLPSRQLSAINDELDDEDSETPASPPDAWQLSAPLGVSFWMPAYTVTEPFKLDKSHTKNSNASSGALADKQPPVSIDELYDAEPINFVLMLILMLAFAIIVGPVNLWVFARGRKRYRLLLTTPLLSICFSILIAAMILVADGIGGKGSYNRLFLLSANGNQEVLIEEQYAQTGMLLRRDFNPGEGVWVSSLGSKIKTGNVYVANGKYGLRADSNTYWGSWFGSRRVQGVVLTQVRPSRAGFEISQSADGGYQVISGFPATSPELYMTSADGRSAYRARNVVTGQPAVLEAVPLEELQQWLAQSSTHFGSYSRQKMSRMRIQPGYVYASATDVTAPMPQTVGSITWQPYQTLVIAQVKNAPAGQPESAEQAGASTGKRESNAVSNAASNAKSGAEETTDATPATQTDTEATR